MSVLTRLAIRAALSGVSSRAVLTKSAVVRPLLTREISSTGVRLAVKKSLNCEPYFTRPVLIILARKFSIFFGTIAFLLCYNYWLISDSHLRID
jgi:hypothetical protein